MRLLKFILAEVEIVERLVSIRLTPILLDFKIEIFLRNPGVFLRSLLVPENYEIRLKSFELTDTMLSDRRERIVVDQKLIRNGFLTFHYLKLNR